MDIELIKVDNNNKETFENIYEFYLYEISKYLGYDVEENGKFSDNNTRNYIYNIKREQILIKKNGKYAGFLLIFKRDNYNYINEFGILPKYRSGFFTYKVIRKYFLETNKVTKFNIINENKRWLECVEYIINKNKNHKNGLPLYAEVRFFVKDCFNK